MDRLIDQVALGVRAASRRGDVHGFTLKNPIGDYTVLEVAPTESGPFFKFEGTGAESVMLTVGSAGGGDVEARREVSSLAEALGTLGFTP
jgi:hypothetical protein